MTVLPNAVAAPPRDDARCRDRCVYAIDGALLGLFMVSACLVVVLVEHPALPVRGAVTSDLLRRAIIGGAMGLTAVALIYSPWGRRSGALMNPAVAACHWRSGRLTARDAAAYALAHFICGAAGVTVVSIAVGRLLAHPAVNHVATVPGRFGAAVAWTAEFAIAFLMIVAVTVANRSPRVRPFTGCVAGLLVALYITFEAPLSGMSMNPARTFASAVVSNVWTGWWVYATAPLLGMLAGIELVRVLAPAGQRVCGKFTHAAGDRCFIRCDCGADPIPHPARHE